MTYNLHRRMGEDAIQTLQTWAETDDSVRAVILTGSRANPDSATDILSDYDVELYVSSIQPFMSDDWLSFFGKVMVVWPIKPMSTFHKDWITRLVLFENSFRIDFQITAKESPDPASYDSGFRVLLDRCGLTENLMSSPAISRRVIAEPTRDAYEALANAFFWDATYVAKYLWRDEIYFAKYMLDSMLRVEHLGKIIEWYIAARSDQAASIGRHHRIFRRDLDSRTWEDLEATFADAGLENNWQALFNLIGLFRRLATYVAQNLGYDYPYALDQRITDYCMQVKAARKEPR